MISKKNSANSKWKKFKPFLIIIWSIFNPITIFGIIFVVCLIDGIHAANITSQIKKELDPLCLDERCVYYDWERSTVELPTTSERIKHDSKFDYHHQSFFYFDFLLFTDEHYYFLTYLKKESFTKDFYVGRTNLELDDFEPIASLGVGDNIKFASGYSNIAYFAIDTNYYVYDFNNNDLNRIDSNNPEARIANFNKSKCREYSDIDFDALKENDKGFSYTYLGLNYAISNEYIDNQITSLINKYRFKPYYHQSYPSGLSHLVFYANPGPIGESDCLIINYNRIDNNDFGYQMFHGVDRTLFYLFTKVEMN